MSNHSLNEIVESSLRFVDHRIKEQGIRLEKVLSPELPDIYGDADNISQVIINIIVNALDSMSSGGNLIIKTGYCDHQPSNIQVAITDSELGSEKKFSIKYLIRFLPQRRWEVD